MRFRRLLVVAAILFATDTVQALEIAVTNDDGWNAAGLLAIQEALQTAGHQVTLAGPGTDQSGRSAALSVGPLQLIREAADRYSVWACADANCESKVSASPATSGLVALELVRQKRAGSQADLLISGINSGPNLGPAISVSGTVGAATVASLAALGGSVPAISISTELPMQCGDDKTCIKNHYDRVASFLVRVVAALQANGARHHRNSLLPRGQVLNINVPAVGPRGVRWANRSSAFYARGAYRVWGVSCPACQNLPVGGQASTQMSMNPATGITLTRDGDSETFVAGYTTMEFLSQLGRRASTARWGWLTKVSP